MWGMTEPADFDATPGAETRRYRAVLADLAPGCSRTIELPGVPYANKAARTKIKSVAHKLWGRGCYTIDSGLCVAVVTRRGVAKP